MTGYTVERLPGQVLSADTILTFVPGEIEIGCFDFFYCAGSRFIIFVVFFSLLVCHQFRQIFSHTHVHDMYIHVYMTCTCTTCGRRIYDSLCIPNQAKTRNYPFYNCKGKDNFHCVTQVPVGRGSRYNRVNGSTVTWTGALC